MEQFVSVIKNRDVNRIFVSILACSDNDQEIGYLSKLDKEVTLVFFHAFWFCIDEFS